MSLSTENGDLKAFMHFLGSHVGGVLQLSSPCTVRPARGSCNSGSSSSASASPSSAGRGSCAERVVARGQSRL